MSAAAIVGVLVALVVIAGVVWYMLARQRRTENLRAQYGPEYSRTVREVGDQRRAEADLAKRQERVEQLQIQPLTADQQSRFAQQWESVQTRFVDDPKGAVNEADGLVEEVMKTRGYAVTTFEQQAADISVHHPRVVTNYRAAHDIALQHRRGKASTEDLRQAMVYYRELFEDLLEDREHAAERPVERPVAREVQAATDDGARAAQPERRADRDLRP